MANYRYWKIQVDLIGTGTVNTVNLQEVELRETAGGANLAYAGNGTPIASSTDSTYTVDKAFDGNLTTRWLSSGNVPQSVTWDFGAGNEKAILEIALYNGNSTYWAQSFSPFSGKFYCSSDGTNWGLVGSFTARTNAFSTWTTHALTLPGIGTVAITAPSPVLSGFSGASSALTPPAASLFAFGGAIASISSPPSTLYATGHDSTGEQAAALTAPSPALSAYGGANCTLTGPSPTLAITATVTNLGKSDLTSPAPILSASGTVAATAQASLSAPMASLIGYSGAVCSITLTDSPTLMASGTTGGIGGAALTCPLFELTASGTEQNHGSANLLAPSPRMGATAQAYLIAPGATLTAIGSAVVTATYEAYAINLNHNDPAANNEVTRYTNFPFTQIVRYQGSYFGVAAGGLYLLEGTTDDGAEIPWAFKSAMTDFKSPFLKTVVSAYFGGRLGPAATIDLHAGEDGAARYSYATVRSDHAQRYRQKFGRGVSANYYALGAAGTGTLELDNIEFETLNSNRRI